MAINITTHRKVAARCRYNVNGRNGQGQLSKKSYSDRLKALKLPTLKYRRYRGDMIELFKIIKGIYDPACVPHFEYMELTDNLIRTRGNTCSASLSLRHKEI